MAHSGRQVGGSSNQTDVEESAWLQIIVGDPFDHSDLNSFEAENT